MRCDKKKKINIPEVRRLVRRSKTGYGLSVSRSALRVVKRCFIYAEDVNKLCRNLVFFLTESQLILFTSFNLQLPTTVSDKL